MITTNTAPKPNLTRKNAVVFVLCLVVAIFFWGITSLSYTFNTEIQININPSGLPVNKSVDASFPSTVRAVIEITGWNYLSMGKGGLNETVNINLRNSFDGQSINLKDKLQQGSTGSSPFKILSVIPENFKLHLIPTKGKFVKIKSGPSIPLEKGFGLTSEIKFDPDSVWVTAPEKILNGLDEIRIDISGVKPFNSDVDDLFPIEKIKGEEVKITPEFTTLSARVGKVTQKSIQVEITPLNPPGKAIQLLPEMVLVNFSVPFDRYEKINADSFILVVDFTNFEGLESLEVQTVKQPGFISGLRITPPFVNYIIRK
jgi:hypothetical protein